MSQKPCTFSRHPPSIPKKHLQYPHGNLSKRAGLEGWRREQNMSPNCGRDVLVVGAMSRKQKIFLLHFVVVVLVILSRRFHMRSNSSKFRAFNPHDQVVPPRSCRAASVTGTRFAIYCFCYASRKSPPRSSISFCVRANRLLISFFFGKCLEMKKLNCEPIGTRQKYPTQPGGKPKRNNRI